MPKERLFIVENEGIVTAHLESVLQILGYQIAGLASSGEESVEMIENTMPDLVLMDIRLKGKMDGIDVAEQVTARLNLPVIFLTSCADDKTLERAKATMPSAYILKPFKEKDLRIAVELALYKHKMESIMSTMEGWHAWVLQSMGESVIAIDTQGHITFMNHMAESLLGWKLSEIYGNKIENNLFLSQTSSSRLAGVISSIERQDGHSTPYYSSDPISLLTKNGHTIHVQYSLAAIKDETRRHIGIVIVLHESALKSNALPVEPIDHIA